MNLKIRDTVYTWDDDALPAPRLPVRCLEDELVPHVTPIRTNHVCAACGQEIHLPNGGRAMFCKAERCQRAAHVRRVAYDERRKTGGLR